MPTKCIPDNYKKRNSYWMCMINKSGKMLAGAIFVLFALFEFLMIMFGETIMVGHRIVGVEARIYPGSMIAVAAFSMILIFKDRTVGYLILGLSVTITLIVHFGHRMLWWPCGYCSL